MKHRVLLPMAVGVMIAITSLGVGAQVVAITNPSITLTADDLRDVFLGDKQLAGSTKLVPVDNESAQDLFLAKVVKLDATRYTNAWTKKSFRDGLTPPTIKATDAEVVDFVKRTSGAVGYVKSAPPAGVNTIALP
jgi:ABC-type phosphate transport system substrate-binding protein